MNRVVLSFVIALIGLTLFIVSIVELVKVDAPDSHNAKHEIQITKDSSNIGKSIQNVNSQSNQPKPEDNNIYTTVAQMPQFVGGEEALNEYVKNNLSYPHIARANKVSGIITARFIINKNGEISDISILNDIGEGCGDEAIRLIKNMPSWIPGYQDNEPKRVLIDFPITFTLPPPLYMTCSYCNGLGYVSKDEVCSNCRGRKYTLCSYCSGNGMRQCSQCSGSCYINCNYCNGKGYYNCSYCNGRGYNQCKSCNGYGYLFCRTCNGKGIVRDQFNRLRSCPGCRGKGKFTCNTCRGYKNIMCSNCRGQKKFKCQYCNGHPQKSCSYCRGTGNIRCEYCGGSCNFLCSNCNGTGYFRTKVICTHCNGSGQIESN